MDHIVHLESEAQELEKLLAGTKTALIRGASSRKIPYGRVAVGDTLYYVCDDDPWQVIGRSTVRSVFYSDPLSPQESLKLVQVNQPRLQLSADQTRRWSIKRYLVLVEVGPLQPVEPFAVKVDESSGGEGWWPVRDISAVRVPKG